MAVRGFAIVMPDGRFAVDLVGNTHFDPKRALMVNKILAQGVAKKLGGRLFRVESTGVSRPTVAQLPPKRVDKWEF